jgi:leucyl aminopeptidase
MGYPTTLPAEGLFEDSNPNIHSSRDTLAVLNLEHAIEYSKIGLAYAVEMALN